MKTGYFKQIDDSAAKGFISISLYPSNNDNVSLEFRSLAPNWKLMKNLKSNKISEATFVKEYFFTTKNEDLAKIQQRIFLNKKTCFVNKILTYLLLQLKLYNK